MPALGNTVGCSHHRKPQHTPVDRPAHQKQKQNNDAPLTLSRPLRGETLSAAGTFIGLVIAYRGRQEFLDRFS